MEVSCRRLCRGRCISVGVVRRGTGDRHDRLTQSGRGLRLRYPRHSRWRTYCRHVGAKRQPARRRGTTDRSHQPLSLGGGAALRTHGGAPSRPSHGCGRGQSPARHRKRPSGGDHRKRSRSCALSAPTPATARLSRRRGPGSRPRRSPHPPTRARLPSSIAWRRLTRRTPRGIRAFLCSAACSASLRPIQRTRRSFRALTERRSNSMSGSGKERRPAITAISTTIATAAIRSLPADKFPQLARTRYDAAGEESRSRSWLQQHPPVQSPYGRQRVAGDHQRPAVAEPPARSPDEPVRSPRSSSSTQANQIYVYPEHRDHDPDHGDLIPGEHAVHAHLARLVTVRSAACRRPSPRSLPPSVPRRRTSSAKRG